MKQQNNRSAINAVLAGATLLVAGLLFLDIRGKAPADSRLAQPEACQGTVNTQVQLSREQVAEFLTIPERDAKSKVQTILGKAYCQLPGLQVRAGVTADREVYPLAFEPQTRLVVLYEGDEYAGFKFDL